MPRRFRRLNKAFCLLAGLLALLLTPASAEAHRLLVDWQVFRGPKVVITCLYSDPLKPYPAAGASVRVYRSGRQIHEGTTDDRGQLQFSLEKVEPLRIVAYQEGHQEEVVIPAADLAKALPDAAAAREDGTNPPAGSVKKDNGTEVNKESVVASGGTSGSGGKLLEAYVQNGLLAISFLLAVAAFFLSLRNARRLQQLRRDARESASHADKSPPQS